jgi:hypothetical protein
MDSRDRASVLQRGWPASEGALRGCSMLMPSCMVDRQRGGRPVDGDDLLQEHRVSTPPRAHPSPLLAPLSTCWRWKNQKCMSHTTEVMQMFRVLPELECLPACCKALHSVFGLTLVCRLQDLLNLPRRGQRGSAPLAQGPPGEPTHCGPLVRRCLWCEPLALCHAKSVRQ